MAESTGKKRLRDSWTNDQTDLLLEIIREKNIFDKLDSKKFRKAKLFEKEIVSEFEKRNIKKNLGQITDKLDNLKRKYKKIKNQLSSKTGTGTEEKNKFREFDTLDEILGSRAGYNLSGIDSSFRQTISDGSLGPEVGKTDCEGNMGSANSKDEFELECISPGKDTDLDIASFLYDNDPDFRAQCVKLMEETGFDKDRILQIRRKEIDNEQRIAYTNMETSNNVCSQTVVSKDSPYDKVLRNVESKEKDAASKFRMNVLEEQDNNIDNSAKYSSAKGKKKSSAVAYAEMSKENAKELQNDLIIAQKEMINNLWMKQGKFLAKNTKETLKAEERIALVATDRLVQGLLAGFGKNTAPKAQSPKKTSPEKKRNQSDEFFMDERSDDGYFDGIDSSYH